MTVYKLNVPDTASVVGQLYGRELADELSEDMLLVKVAGHGIDVRWFPPYSVAGSYIVRVYKGNWQQVVDEREFADPRGVKRFIEATSARLAHQESLQFDHGTLHRIALEKGTAYVLVDVNETSEGCTTPVVILGKTFANASPMCELRASTFATDDMRILHYRMTGPEHGRLKRIPSQIPSQATFTL